MTDTSCCFRKQLGASFLKRIVKLDMVDTYNSSTCEVEAGGSVQPWKGRREGEREGGGEGGREREGEGGREREKKEREKKRKVNQH